ncbi:hypothetical protein Droror1_Dr00024672 [Drosera rotundifolia]
MSTSAEGQWRRHMAAFSFPWASHAAPLLLLVRHLAAASPDVLFTFFGTKDTNNNIFKEGASPLPNILPHVVDDGVPEGHVFSSHHWEPTRLFLKAAMEGSFKKGMEEAEAAAGVEISCVIADAFIWFYGDIAAENGATWVAFWTAAAATLSTHFHTDVLRARIGTQDLDAWKDELVGTIPGFSTVRICDLYKVYSLEISPPLSAKCKTTWAWHYPKQPP